MEGNTTRFHEFNMKYQIATEGMFRMALIFSNGKLGNQNSYGCERSGDLCRVK